MNARLAEIASIWKANQWLYAIPGILIGIVIGFIVGITVSGTIESISVGLLAFFEGIWAEILGITFTVFIIDQIYKRREEQRNIRERNERLIRQIGSTVNDVAKDAIHEASKLGLLEGENGLLKGANLQYANLERTGLKYANLEKALLSRAILKNSGLFGVNLIEAQLTVVDFSEANLEDANLKGSGLSYANLRGANLRGANLAKANLKHTQFDINTTLPNGEKWEESTDMKQFTERSHPDFEPIWWTLLGHKSRDDFWNDIANDPDDDTENP